MGGESACRGGGNVDRESDDGAFLIDLCLFVCRRVCRRTWPIHRALRTRSAPFPPEHTHTHTHTHAESTTCSEPSTLSRRSPPRAHALAAAVQHGMCGRSHREVAEGIGALYVVLCMCGVRRARVRCLVGPGRLSRWRRWSVACLCRFDVQIGSKTECALLMFSKALGGDSDARRKALTCVPHTSAVARGWCRTPKYPPYTRPGARARSRAWTACRATQEDGKRIFSFSSLRKRMSTLIPVADKRYSLEYTEYPQYR